MDRVGYPLLAAITGRQASVDLKIIAGFSFAIGSQLVAAAIEYHRLASPVLGVPSHCAPYIDGTDEHVHMSAATCFYMLVPNAMVGIGEIFVYPVIIALVHENAAPEFRSLLQAFNFFTMDGLPMAV